MKRALISVSDKTGIVEFAKGLRALGWEVIATGGTIEASIQMIEELGGEVVKVIFLMELAGLKGRERLQGYDVDSVIIYEGK